MATIGGANPEMRSRTGELVKSCDHILDELLEAYRDGEYRGQMVVIGEVWHPNLSFPTISGKFRRHSPAPDLHFVVNDMLPECLETDDNYITRWGRMEEFLPSMPNVQVYLAQTWKTGTWKDAMQHARVWQAKGGYDGAILRNPYEGYKVGLVKHGEIIKVKPTLSLDLAVNAIVETPGAKTGRAVYTLMVTYRGVTSMVGSGVPHADADLPVVGQIVEVECLDITDDGKLREPRFKGIRYDKETQDT
jgi:DNA ligase-1